MDGLTRKFVCHRFGIHEHKVDRGNFAHDADDCCLFARLQG